MLIIRKGEQVIAHDLRIGRVEIRNIECVGGESAIGQIVREPGQPHIPAGTDAGTQWKVALGNLVTVLKAAGGQPTHLVALRAYVTDIAEFNAAGAAIGAAWGSTLGRHFPAMTLVQVSALIDPHDEP